VRVLTANGFDRNWIDEVFADEDPTIVAATSVSPAEACAVATERSLHYAVQCWDDPLRGKAIFWKPVIALQGLYRTEFQDRGAGSGEQSGLLRVTFLWDGHPLNVLCAQLARRSEEDDLQIAQVAREASAARGAALVAIEPAPLASPEWPGFSDAWTAARWRSIVPPGAFDVGEVARSSFGLAAIASSGSGKEVAAWLQGGRLRLLCSEYFSVVRARYRPSQEAAGNGPLVVDLTADADAGLRDRDTQGPSLAAATGSPRLPSA
jgi:hypothetical protein